LLVHRCVCVCLLPPSPPLAFLNISKLRKPFIPNSLRWANCQQSCSLTKAKITATTAKKSILSAPRIVWMCVVVCGVVLYRQLFFF
jgi:hypothetical protein